MREIKFRGYSKMQMLNSQWLYGFGVMDIDYTDGTIEWHLHTMNGTYEVFPESIGQYTGLKDKNGNEIYEGDIVAVIDEIGDEIISKVTFGGEEYPAFDLPSYDGYDMNAFSAIYFSDNGEEITIIGNIYEHKHLLDGDSNDRHLTRS